METNWIAHAILFCRTSSYHTSRDVDIKVKTPGKELSKQVINQAKYAALKSQTIDPGAVHYDCKIRAICFEKI